MGNGSMSQIDAIFQAMSFAEDHLQAPINVAMMAEAAAYSLYYFCRMFGKLTRHTPYDYLIRRRLTQAALEVVQTPQKIIDIALDYQFNSHEGFTRAFGRVFGVSPTEAREQGYVPLVRCLPALTYPHLFCLHTHDYLVPVMMPLPDRVHAVSSCCVQVTDDPASENRWHTIPVPRSAGEPIDSAIGSDLCACFTLVSTQQDLPLILDWVLHTWLFYAHYRLEGESLFIQRSANHHQCLFVPVSKR